MKLLIALVLVLSAIAGLTAAPSPESSYLLTDGEMGTLIGEGCSQALGVYMSLAFASGLTAAPAPPLSAGFLLAAGLLGVGMLVFC